MGRTGKKNQSVQTSETYNIKSGCVTHDNNHRGKGTETHAFLQSNQIIV